MNIDFILANEVKYLIERNNMQVGDQLPSERELCDMFSCQRLSIRSGLKILEDQGIIVSKPKSGYYIKKKKISKNTKSISSVTDELFQHQINASTKLVSCKLLEANKENIEFLHCDLGEKFYRIERLRIVDDEPICFDVSYVSFRSCPGMDKKDFENNSLYRIMNTDYSILLDKSEQTVDVIQANGNVAKLLGVNDGSTLVYQYGAVYCHGQLVEYSDSFMKPDWFEYNSK